MSKATGVKGKDPQAVARAKTAADRKAAYEKRRVEEQLALLDTRPGAAVKERDRLLKKLG